MADCDTSIAVGKSVLVEWSPACGDADFLTLTYKLFGSTNTKGRNFSASTADTTNDNSGAYTSTIVTRLDGEITVSGFQDKIDSVLSNQLEYIAYLHNEVQAGRQPSCWIKISGPGYGIIEYIYCVITGEDKGFNTDDPNSFSTTLKPTNTDTVGVQAYNAVPVV